jgi:predicted outer membrane repeat protein
MKKITILTVCLTLFLVGSISAQQEVFVAAPSDRTIKDGISPETAFDSFATALLNIDSAGDVLKVVGTVIAGSHNLTSVSATSTNKNFQYTIEGVGVGATLAGTPGLVRMFTINAASAGQDVTFKNITFSGSTGSTGAGGGVLLCNQPVTVNFENCIFDGNSLASTVTAGGGALYFSNVTTPTVLAGPTVTITNCTFKNNISPNIGGAIYSNSTLLNPGSTSLTITGTTFYNNKTLGTVGTVWGGSALTVGAGSASVNSLTNCTFYQNTSIFPVSANQDYGAIRTENGNTTVTNCLFYNNKAAIGNPITSSSPSDWGSSPNGTQTFNKSIGQWITSNIDVVTSSVVFKRAATAPYDVAANLASSNLTFDDTVGEGKVGKVTYNATITAGETSPKDFVSPGEDAGAWTYDPDNDPSLSVTDTEIAAVFSVSYDSKIKNLKVIRSNDDSVTLEIYNLMGSKVFSRTNASKEENINASALQSGVYILVVKGSESKSFAQKFVIN